MRWIYFGTGLLSSQFLDKLIESHLLPSLVITGSPKPYGRGRKLFHAPVFMVAHKKAIPVIETHSLQDPVIVKKIQMETPSYFVVFDFGHIIPTLILKIPKIAPINIHPSLLPAYRGAAPIIRAMMNGERNTGITVIIMNEKVDAGDIVLQKEISIPPYITRGELEEKLLTEAVKLLDESFKGLQDGHITPEPQKGKPSYARKIQRNELWINWNDTAVEIKNIIHALSPQPGARSMFKEKIVQFMRAKIPGNMSLKLEAGRIHVMGKRLIVGTSDTPLEILSLKPSGKREMAAIEFINGYRPDNLYFTSR